MIVGEKHVWGMIMAGALLSSVLVVVVYFLANASWPPAWTSVPSRAEPYRKAQP